MDVNVNSEVLSNLQANVKTCQKKLNDCLQTIKAEFKIVDFLLAGEQFEEFKNQAKKVCEELNNTINKLSSSKSFLKKLQAEIDEYEKTKYRG